MSKKKSHHITNSASFTNCGRLLKKKEEIGNLKKKKMSTIVLILFFDLTMRSIGIP